MTAACSAGSGRRCHSVVKDVASAEVAAARRAAFRSSPDMCRPLAAPVFAVAIPSDVLQVQGVSISARTSDATRLKLEVR